MATRPAQNAHLLGWVDEWTAVLGPEKVHWCDGSREEYDALTARMVQQGTLLRLDATRRPRSFLCRSDPRDVARVEGCTFICSRVRGDAGPGAAAVPAVAVARAVGDGGRGLRGSGAPA